MGRGVPSRWRLTLSRFAVATLGPGKEEKLIMDSPIYLTAGYAPYNPICRSVSTPGILLLLLALLGYCAFSPAARGLLPAPSPDGGYPGQNTAEGSNALAKLNYS